MSLVDYPDELKAATWDKKKGSLPPGSDVHASLKTLQKKHDAVDWKLFEPAWLREAKTSEELDEAFARRDRLYRSGVIALKRDGNEVASSAQRLAKDKAAGKPTLDAVKSIVSAVNAYSKAIDSGEDALRKAYEKARGALPEEGEDGEDDEDSAASALLDPKRLLKQLQLCKRDPERTMRFGFVDAKDKSPAALAVHPKVDGRKLFGKLQKETGVKTGAYGSLWIDGSSLMLQLDKPLGGLVKKIRAPVKACGFKIAKVVLWNEDGSVFEQDEQDEEAQQAPGPAIPKAPSLPPAGAKGGAAAPAQPAAPAGPTASDEAEFAARLKALLAGMAKLQPAQMQPIKLLGSEAGVFARKKEWSQAGVLMGRAEALLAAAPAPGVVPTEPALPGGDAPRAGGTEATFTAGLKALMPQIAGAPQPASQQAKRLASEAGVFARKKEWTRAEALLEEIRELLGPPRAAPPLASPRVVFTQTRLAWDQTRKQVQADLQKLERSILEACKTEPDLADIAAGTKGLYRILDHLDERLIDKLDEALNAGAEDERRALHQQAREIVDEYLDYVRSDDLMRDIDNNGFADVAIAATLTARLTDMSRQLKIAVAA